MERSPLLSPLQTASSQLKSSRIHSTVSSPGGVQHLRSSSRSPPPPTKPRSESHDRSYPNARKLYERSRSQERDERSRPRDFPNTDRRRPPRNGSVALSGRNGPDGSPPSEMGFQESPRLKYPERFPLRDARFRSSESLKNSPIMSDHPGQPSLSSRHFGSSSAPNTSSLSHPRDFSPPGGYKNSFNELSAARSIEYFQGASPGVGSSIGLGLGPGRYMERDDWRGRLGHFHRDFERDRDNRIRDVRQDIRDIRDPRLPRDPREMRDLRERDMREREMLYPRESDFRDRDPRDRDLRELGITTRELRDRDNRERDLRERGLWSADMKGRDSFSGREGPELDVRELVERERERERDRDRERDRNRERPIWLRDLDKEMDSTIPIRPALDNLNREREKERERTSSSRAMSTVQELDRDLLAYTSDKSRQTTGKSDETQHGVERYGIKPGSFSGPSLTHGQREPKQQDDDDAGDRDRARDRDRLSLREVERDDASRERGYDIEQLRDRERDFHNRPDGAGLRSDMDGRPRNVAIGRRQRILSAPTSDDTSHSEISGSYNREQYTRSGHPNSPAVSASAHQGRSGAIEHPDDRLQYRRSSSTTDSATDSRSSSKQGPVQAVKSELVEKTGRTDRATAESSRRSLSQADRLSSNSDTSSKVSVAIHSMRDEAPAPAVDAQKTKGISSQDRPLGVPSAKDTVSVEDFSLSSAVNSEHRKDGFMEIDPDDEIVKQEAPVALGPVLSEINDILLATNVDGDSTSNVLVTTKDFHEIKAARSPSMNSLPSPGLSPVHEVSEPVYEMMEPEAVDVPGDGNVPVEAVEFENHADILVEIDKIDGEIQVLEDTLNQHRIDKVQSEVKINAVVLDTTGDEDVPIDIEHPDTESVPDGSAMDLDSKVTLGVPDESKEMDSLIGGDEDVSSPVDLVPDRDTEDSRLEVVNSEDVDMMGSDTGLGKDQRRQIIEQFSRQELQHPIDENDPYLKRKEQQKRRPQLFDQIYAENNTRAKKYGRIHSAPGSSRNAEQPHHHHRHEQDRPKIFESVEDYPCYQENIDNHERLKGAMRRRMVIKAVALDEKELELKREYKQHWEAWTKKVEKLDKIKEKTSNASVQANVREEDMVQSDNVLFTTRNRRGAYNSDAVRSEAELMEIIQSLENADMRNPDLRASRTAATVPPMILDPYEREKVHYYDRNHLVTDPAKYYRLGPVTDPWTEEERQIFIKRYLNYPKQFGKIAAGIEGKTASQCVLFYYREKKKIGFKDMLSNRGRKRKPAAGKRKEKVAQPSPSGQPGKKHKGSALIEDIGQANRKMAKSKEIRELQDMNQTWGDLDAEPTTRRRVRSGAASQQGGTPGLEESNSNAASPAPSSATSTPAISATERRRQRIKGTTTRSSAVAASNPKALAEDVVVEEKKKSKSEKGSPAPVVPSIGKTVSKAEEAIVSVDSPTVDLAVSKQPPVVTHEPVVENVTTAGVTPAPAAGAIARWTTAEHVKCIAALKKYGRDFEAVANAVGTKTVDQCKNFCFNYKRKFGVSALDDANNLDLSVLGEGGEEKDVLGAGIVVEKSKGRKGKTTTSSAMSAPGTPNNTTAGGVKDAASTPSGRRKTGKAAVQEIIKDEAVKAPVVQTASAEESEAVADKKKRKRVVSKNEAGPALTEAMSAACATSFRALYSRDPPSEANSPSTPAVSQIEDPLSAQPGVDGSARRPNFSSYWSRQEKIDFARLLSVHGKDWDKISKALKTKTLIQVRNHYSNNADKLAAEAVIGTERPVSPSPPARDNGETYLENERDCTRHPAGEYGDQGMGERVDEHNLAAYSGPKPGFFMPFANAEDRADSNHREESRAITPPRRVTNIGNLLNNDDEDVNVAVEDWFGNSEEGSAQSQEHSFEADGPPEQEDPMPRQPQRYVGEGARYEEEDVETEDEYEPVHHAQGVYGSRQGSAGIMIPNQRRASEANASLGRHVYPSSAPTGPGYYGHPQQPPHPSQQQVGRNNAGVLGSPYGAPQYYSSSHPSSGYRSPPPISAPAPAPHLQRTTSPSAAASSAPPSAVMQPGHYPLPLAPYHHQHQRSSSISHVEMIPRSNPSPQSTVRARSPMSRQGSYFAQPQQHGYAHSPSHAPYGYPQHHTMHHPSQMEVLSPHPRPINEPSTIPLHPSSSVSVASHVHGHSHGHAHSGSVSRYSSSPQLAASVNMRGSPGPGGPSNGPGSPVHVGHGGHMPSRYSPIPTSAVVAGSVMPGLVGTVTSPRMSEPPVHHHQHHQYQQHMRRSSSPFQHHIPGQIHAPSYLQPPPGMHPSSNSKHQSSSSFSYGPSTPASMLPPPLPVSSGVVSSAGYHPSHQQHPSYGHPQHPAHSYGPLPPHHRQQQQQPGRHHHPQ